MGISVELWRARIGSYCCGSNNLLLFIFPASNLVSGIFLSIAIILLLLVIGNIELNPGPEDLWACYICNFKAKTLVQHIHHQKLHADLHNFFFRCPVPLCQHSYSSFKSMQAHLSHHQIENPDRMIDQDADSSKCVYCDMIISSNRGYCKHLKSHLKDGLSVRCPFSSCSRSNAFTSLSVFSTHLSQCHPGWSQDYSLSVGTVLDSHGLENFDNCDSANVVQDYSMPSPPSDVSFSDSDSSSICSSEARENDLYDHDQVIEHIAHFYVMLEGKKIVPSATVDTLAKKLSFISEILHEKLKRDLKRTLSQVGISADAIQNVIQAVLSDDPFYNAHHEHAPADTLLTFERRKTYYKNHFKHQDFVGINLKKNPKDQEDQLQYVDVKESLEIMLQDPSVKRELCKSFNAPDSDGTLLKDYRDGSAFRDSSTPKKTIDLLLFMDALTCSNSLGSAKKKHKIHGMYLTLGNFSPYLRSYLQAMRLVLLVNDKSLKKSERMFRKSFQRVLRDIKSLEENGIDFNGERIPVRLRYVQGNNLGQNTLGGFVESFTNTFFCRFCDIHYDTFKEDVAVERPKPKFGNWRTPESYNEDLREKEAHNLHNSHGVKRDSPFHSLNDFHVCDPRLAPCIGHDLFINGVVDLDLRSMIDYFIQQNWFTLPELNMRIKRFTYLGKDKRNKPAEIPEDSQKLGGHAIQNWTLFRLLPVLIHDKIKEGDKTWRLYLLLKSIVELVCAPALTRDQVEVMRKLIKKYWRRRTILLNNNYLPKHHIFSHYPTLYLIFGPLIHLWSMAFEHRHQYFKRVAKICNNFINLGHTLAQKYQLLQAYQNMGQMFSENAVFGETSPLQEETIKDSLQELITSSRFGKDAVTTKDVTLNQIQYRRNEWLLLGSSVIDGEKLLSVGQIKLFVYDEGVCTTIIKKYQAHEWKELGLYCVSDKKQAEVCSINLNQLENPVPHPKYNIDGKYCFSLKHAFVANCKYSLKEAFDFPIPAIFFLILCSHPEIKMSN